MTTTSFFCRKKALWPFPPITLPRPEPFVNPATRKDSFWWYKKVIESNGEDLG